jgi:class 3 adenylate cyclase
MFGLSRLSIQSKLIMLLLAVSLGSIAAIAWTGYTSAKASLTKAVQESLKGTRYAKTQTLQAMLGALREQVISISDSKLAQDSMRAFATAYRELNATQLAPAESVALDRYYEEFYIPELAKYVAGEPVAEQYTPRRMAERYLQYHYIVSGREPGNKGSTVAVSPTDRSNYAQVHAQFHEMFERVAKIFEFQDILLIDPETMDIVYSYDKTTEFGTNLENGPYSNTYLGLKARELRFEKDRDNYKLADFEPYRPYFGKPMAFALSPIFDGPDMIGILALQFPIDTFNKVLTGNFNWAEEGLGETGEAYLVGPDRTMRSWSRFMYQDPKGFVQEMRTSGISQRIVDNIEKQGSVLCLLPINTSSVEEAFRGKTGIMEVTDYRGKKVLSAYGPIELNSLRWAVIAEQDLSEAYAPIVSYGRRVLMIASGTALLATLLALLFAHWMTRPLRLLADGARRLGDGDTNVQVKIKSADEFGLLGLIFNEMAENIKLQKEKLETQVRENQELLLNILPASAVAQRKEGDERASREFADVSVLFAEIVGMEEFSVKAGESKALSALGDLVAAFDEAAERSGIEKVKTIGGSYLAVCGLSVSRPDHARRVIVFSQEMARIIGIFNREHGSDLGIAVGVNSGPVVGGVIGRRKFLYDLWGDTVTIAKKLATGHEAAIRVTEPVRERLGDQFQFDGPLRVNVEGRAPIEAWQVTG